MAAFHGYLPSFNWRDSEVAKYELSQLVHDHAIAQAADTDGRTVRQDRHSLSPEQLQLLSTYAMSRSAADQLMSVPCYWLSVASWVRAWPDQARYAR